jgi:hypothetical protein
LISKLIISCHELSLDKKSSDFVCKVLGERAVCERDFFQADKMGLYKNLMATAESLKKDKIDRETAIKYFGSRRHVKSAMEEAALDGNEIPVPLMTFIFVHTLIPIKIIGKNDHGLIGEYRNKNKKIRLEGVLLFKEDEDKNLEGKTVLFHYAPIVSATVDDSMVAFLLEEQLAYNDLAKVIANLDGKTVAIYKFSKAIKRSMASLEL